MNRPVLFLVGPTGSGKTDLSLCLAKRLGCEIISADSMLVYRGMNIGTAKPPTALRRKIRHHLIDLVSPSASFSVHEHRRRSLQIIQEILKRGKLPLVVGGGGLYVNALWKGMSAHPSGDDKFRGKLNQIAKKNGLAYLYEELRKLDPERAREIHPHDRRRIFRALEIVKVSGKTSSEWFQNKVSLEDLGFTVQVFGIERSRGALYERINRRVEAMFRRGFFNEVKRLKRIGFSKTSGQALGYRETLLHLRRGEKKATRELIEEIQRGTRQFAKRQLTWFRREKEIRWISWNEGESVSLVCGKIIREAKSWLNPEPSS